MGAGKQGIVFTRAVDRVAGVLKKRSVLFAVVRRVAIGTRVLCGWRVRRREHARERRDPPAFGEGLDVLFGGLEQVAVDNRRGLVEDVGHGERSGGGG